MRHLSRRGPRSFAFAATAALLAVLAAPATALGHDGEMRDLPAATTQQRSATLPIVYRVDTDDPVVFLTIDDGIITPTDARDWVRRGRLPITSFLTSSVIRGRQEYFAAISRRGSVQNHTVSHPSLDTFRGDLRTQICPLQSRYRTDFGERPWMLRPPYGAGARLSRVHDAARDCGITHIVMWDAVVDRGVLTTWNGQRLSRGSIILMHYSARLLTDLQVAVRAARDQGLQIAALEDYLPAPGADANR